MNFNEKFIDANIAKLAKEYDCIRGSAVNISRITPDFIDGLKPVQRRSLYVMFLKDQGKTFRKLATISGDVFGRVHPHCLHPDTEFIFTDGTRKTIAKLNEKRDFSGHVMSYDFNNDEFVEGEIIDVRLTKYVDQFYQINLSSGGSIKCTEDHCILTYRKIDGKYIPVWVRADKLSIGELLCGKDSYVDDRSYRGFKENPIRVSSIEVVKCDNLPMYDYTVDVYGNAAVYTGTDPNTNYSFVIVKNSPTAIEDSIVGMAQEWHNNIPLIDGEGNWGSCHDDKTEVLTKDGFKLFKDITYDDELMSFDIDTEDFISEKPTNIIMKEYCGPMVISMNKDVNFCVTPDHVMLTFKSHKPFPKIERKQAKDLYSQYGIPCMDIEKNTYDWYSAHIGYVDYAGIVYCAEVPTYHNLITRRNGCILLSGNCSGDPAGASRYIKARLSEYAQACFFEDWKDSVVDEYLAYDEETYAPLFLPAKYPNVLLNGVLGIGYGRSSNVPAYNFKEIVEATMMLMMNPDAHIVLIPDSPSGADIVETDFVKLSETGNGVYTQRCKYEIDAENNVIRITNLPYLVTANVIREKIADIKEHNGLPELIGMKDMSGKVIDIHLIIRDDVNPYKFMRKLISSVGGLERSYPVNITVVNDYQTFDYSIKQLLSEWIRYRREQKRVVVTHKRTSLLAEQRTNDVKIFLMNKHNLDDTIKIFRNNRSRADIEKALIEKYKNSEIRMDSLQARTLSNLRLIDLSIDAYEACVKRRDELLKELKEVEELLNKENGIDKIIIAELKDGVKRFGKPRRSNVVPKKISISSEVNEVCILQLSSDGNIVRRVATNVDEEPVPTDHNGFAVKVDDDSSFIIVNELGYHSFIRVKDLPLDSEVPVSRYSRQNIEGNIVAMLPYDIESSRCCTLISKMGMLKRIRISDMKPSKRPCIDLSDGDKLIKGIVTAEKSTKDVLVYTNNGMGQRFDPNSTRITSPYAKGNKGFILKSNDEIVGCYLINPKENEYILYVTTKGKMRLNLLEYLSTRDSKHDDMVRLIDLPDRDKLLSVIGCNKLDKVKVFYSDGTNEIISIRDLPEETMASDPKKYVNKNMVTSSVVKVKLI